MTESSSNVSRLLVAIGAVSFAAIALGYLLAPPDAAVRSWVANLSWIWSALYAVACSGYAWRRAAASRERTAWAWVGAGCAAYLAGQLVWSYYALARGVQPPYPSLADVGYLAAYPCLLVAVLGLWRGNAQRRLDVEVAMDALLVTCTAAALMYEFLLEPMLRAGGSALALATSVIWAVGSIAILWLILIQMIYRLQFLGGGAGFVLLALALLCVTNVAYAMAALGLTYAPGGALDLGWDAGLLLLGAGAAAAPRQAPAGETRRAPAPGLWPRTVALAIAFAGIAALAVRGARAPGVETDLAVLVVLGIAIVALRVLHSIRSDRRYADMLEREVAGQTRTLMDALAATSSAERNLRLVMEAVPDAIAVVARDGRTLEMNVPAARLLGSEVEPDGLRSVFDFVIPDAARVMRENLEAAFAGEVRRFEVPIVRPDGTRGMSSVLCAPVREAGQTGRVLLLARDITDLRRAEAQLQQADKLAAMGQLVSGVAHEINNPAAIISGFAQTLLLDDLRPEQRDMIKMIYDEATRIGRITSNLLAFARAGGRERSLVDMNDIVRRTFALRAYHLSTVNVTVNLELDASEPKVWGNGSQLQQVLLNFLINAEQALVTVPTERAITLRTRSAGETVTMECADTGPGIPADIRDRIFDPFFTTKGEGVGTGLGLSICYGIAHDHGGRITVESEPGRGAMFAVTLPRDPRTQARAHAPAPGPAAAGHGMPLSVLLVEDESGLRNAVARFLNRRGIKCRAVGDGAAALEALRIEDVDVILSDIRMPGMNGREFLARLRAERPELVARLIFSTGDTHAPETAALLKEAGLPSLVKPFDFAKLEALIRDVVAKASG